MRTIRSMLFSLVVLAFLAGCGGRDVELPEDPAAPPEGEPESTSAPEVPT